MALDTLAIGKSIINVLKNNTLTMAASLTSATQINTIKLAKANSRPIDIHGYPAVLVQLVREEESFAQLGQRNNDHKLEWLVVPLLQEGSSAENSMTDIMTLTKNIKAVLKANHKLSSTALYSLPVSVDYVPVELDGVFCSASIITFETNHLST